MASRWCKQTVAVNNSSSCRFLACKQNPTRLAAFLPFTEVQRHFIHRDVHESPALKVSDSYYLGAHLSSVRSGQFLNDVLSERPRGTPLNNTAVWVFFLVCTPNTCSYLTCSPSSCLGLRECVSVCADKNVFGCGFTRDPTQICSNQLAFNNLRHNWKTFQEHQLTFRGKFLRIKGAHLYSTPLIGTRNQFARHRFVLFPYSEPCQRVRNGRNVVKASCYRILHFIRTATHIK